MLALRIVAVVGGVCTVSAVLLSAVHTFVLPRPATVRLSRVVFLAVRKVIVPLARVRRRWGAEDDTLALFAPISLLLLPVVWLGFIGAAFTVLYWAVEQDGWRVALTTSGGSLFTLGLVRPPDLPDTFMAFTEAALGIFLLALLITYLPSMYAAFARREAQVALLDSRAGMEGERGISPVAMLIRFHSISGLDDLDDVWGSWESWFVDVEESHLSLAALPFYRSPIPGRSWVTAAGTVLDAAALTESTVDVPNSPRAQLCIRSGYLALRRISDFFNIAYDPDPSPDDATSISRAEFDDAVERMATAGVPIRGDRDQAWRAFNGWRVNYDTVLLALAALTIAPRALWSSDRMPAYAPPPIGRRARRRATTKRPR